ncbi:MAG: AAA family ATPase [Thermomicrobiales bacterium]
MSDAEQGLFVGRAGELAALRDKLAAAREGRGGLALIVGEAGIGKTALARAFAHDAREGGARVLWGACLEGDWQPPYGPWAEALGSHARGLDDERLRQELGANAAPLGRLLPALPLRWPDLPPVAQLRPEDERFRLYDAVAQWLLAIARDTPLVLVLDDLHWADRDSLGLLRYVTRIVEHSPVLIVGTYRDPDPEFDRRGALGDLLAIVQRETAHTRLALGGLGHEQVASYLRGAAGQELPGGLVRAIDAESGGNPFYLREVFRHLVEEGTIVRRAGRWSTDASLNDLGIPEGVRAVLNQRLLRLGEPTHRLLHQAAAFTGGFTFDLIRAVSERDEEAVLDSLDEALRAGLLRVAQPGPPATYDFAHAIVRHTLSDALNPDRQARLHRRIAEALERLPGATPAPRDADHAAQYHASRALPGAARGIPHALAAATAARDGYAHERAAHYLRMARDLAADRMHQPGEQSWNSSHLPRPRRSCLTRRDNRPTRRTPWPTPGKTPTHAPRSWRRLREPCAREGRPDRCGSRWSSVA